MGECKLDHNREEVLKKYESQKEFLPQELHSMFNHFFEKEHTQDIFNEVFHLLKKYDLVTEQERSERNNKLKLVLMNV